MLFLITGKTVTSLTGSVSIIMFDYRHAPTVLMQSGYLLPSISLLDSTGDQEHAMPAYTAYSATFLRALSLKHGI